MILQCCVVLDLCGGMNPPYCIYCSFESGEAKEYPQPVFYVSRSIRLGSDICVYQVPPNQIQPRSLDSRTRTMLLDD